MRRPPPIPCRTATTVLILGIASWTLAACADASSPDRDSTAVRDSAGVAIVENAGDIWSGPRLRRLSPEPLVRIGALEGDEPYLFDGIRGIVALQDGRVVVANSGTNTLRWFDADGTFLFEQGGSGEGPGEFSHLGDLTRTAGDTLLATDWGGRKAVAYAPDGTYVRTTSLAILPGPPGSVFRLADGSFVTGVSGFSSTQLPPDQEPGIFRVATPLIRLSADGTRADTLGMFPGMEVWLRQIGAGMGFGPPPFGKNLHYAITNDRVVVGTGDPFQLDIYEPDGRLVRSIRAPDMDLSVTDAEKDAYRERSLASIPELPEEQRPEAERQIRETVFPRTRPAYGKLLVDRDGGLWVSRYASPSADSAPEWARFDADGRLQEVLEVPSGFVPFDIAGNRIWGRVTDDLGVQYAVAYAFEPM